LAVLVEPLLIIRWVIREQLGILYRRLRSTKWSWLKAWAMKVECKGMAGPAAQSAKAQHTFEWPRMVALTFRATVDVPSRFKNSKAVGAALGLADFCGRRVSMNYRRCIGLAATEKRALRP
jgi:transposase